MRCSFIQVIICKRRSCVLLIIGSVYAQYLLVCLRFSCTAKCDYVSRDVFLWWLLRWVCFASLAIISGLIGILRNLLDSISFKVN